MTDHACVYCAQCIDGGALTMLAEVEPLITGYGELMDLRRRLRFDYGQRFNLAPGHRLLRAALLDRVCRRLVVEHGMAPEAFEAVGDLLPEPPDDLSELDGMGGGSPD